MPSRRSVHDDTPPFWESFTRGATFLHESGTFPLDNVECLMDILEKLIPGAERAFIVKYDNIMARYSSFVVILEKNDERNGLNELKRKYHGMKIVFYKDSYTADTFSAFFYMPFLSASYKYIDMEGRDDSSIVINCKVEDTGSLRPDPLKTFSFPVAKTEIYRYIQVKRSQVVGILFSSFNNGLLFSTVKTFNMGNINNQHMEVKSVQELFYESVGWNQGFDEKLFEDTADVVHYFSVGILADGSYNTIYISSCMNYNLNGFRDKDLNGYLHVNQTMKNRFSAKWSPYSRFADPAVAANFFSEFNEFDGFFYALVEEPSKKTLYRVIKVSSEMHEFTQSETNVRAHRSDIVYKTGSLLEKYTDFDPTRMQQEKFYDVDTSIFEDVPGLIEALRNGHFPDQIALDNPSTFDKKIGVLFQHIIASYNHHNQAEFYNDLESFEGILSDYSRLAYFYVDKIQKGILRDYSKLKTYRTITYRKLQHLDLILRLFEYYFYNELHEDVENYCVS